MTRITLILLATALLLTTSCRPDSNVSSPSNSLIIISGETQKDADVLEYRSEKGQSNWNSNWAIATIAWTSEDNQENIRIFQRKEEVTNFQFMKAEGGDFAILIWQVPEQPIW